ncbi:MAG: hypothetical protein JST91_03005 [Actinobacteria bacterium]|nr:hypothetical protein [Actinomycetota bacterium]
MRGRDRLDERFRVAVTRAQAAVKDYVGQPDDPHRFADASRGLSDALIAGLQLTGGPRHIEPDLIAQLRVKYGLDSGAVD